MKKEIQKKLHTKKDLHHGISPDIQLDYNKKTQNRFETKGADT